MFTGYRCDLPGLAGRRTFRTSFVRISPLFNELAADLSSGHVLSILSRFAVLSDRQVVCKMLAEHVFEATRRLVSANLPSRLNCVYLCRSYSDAERWRRYFETWTPQQSIYECAVVGWYFQGDGNKIAEARSHVENASTIAAVEEGARRMQEVAFSYWKHQPAREPLPELLVEGTVSFVKELP